MKYTTLPNTDIKVSKICLGTMTFGQQNTEAEGHQQLHYALEKGINFIDTAEMYSIPANKATYGSTEKIIGNREKIVLASKIAGPNPNFGYMRENIDFSPASIRFALENSLKRLQTDYIDLYQLHWPERKTNYFGQRSYKDQNDGWEDNFKEVLETLDQLIKQGKIRHIGVSNENPWGIMRFLEESKYHNLPRIKTVQNPYSLLNRLFEIGSAEISKYENVGLLAYSPLAFGVLTGKFLTGENHPKARIKLFPQYTRYSSEQSTNATKLYQEIALKNGLSLTQLAMGFVLQQPFLTSAIIGATTMPQLEENIATINVVLSKEILAQIESVRNIIPDPAP
jgi:aryl-alcohol dehydrogenase-like predicted oxidoreductase